MLLVGLWRPMNATLFTAISSPTAFSFWRAPRPPAVSAEPCGPRPPPLTKFNPDVSEGVCQVIEKCLAKPPDARYPNAAALLRDLEKLLRGEPTSIVVHPKLPAVNPRDVL